MTSDTRDRAIDLAIAAFLALFPLLPAGPTYVGLDWPWALDVFFLAFLAAGLLVLLANRIAAAGAASDHSSEPVRLLRRGYLLWLIPVAGATLLGLLERTPFDATLWGVEAEGLAGRLGRPMNQAVDPFYPLRVGLNCLAGGLMLWLVSALLARTPRPDRRARTALSGCLWGVALVSFIAIVQYSSGAHLHEYWVRANPDLTRSHATLDDPNALASYLVLGIGLAIGAAWSASTRPVGAALAAALALMALVTTVSRAGWAGLLLALLVCAALLPDWLIGGGFAVRAVRRVARSLCVVLILAVAAWTVAATVLPKRTTPLVPSTPWEAAWQTVDPREPLETVLKGRRLLWVASLDLAKQHWVFGAGLAAFPRFVATYPGAGGPENAHNFFLQVLAEAGAIGLAALVLFLIAIASAVWPVSRDRHVARGRLAMGLSMAVLAFVLTWLTGHPLLNLSNQLWLASVLAVGVAALDGLQTAGTGAVAPTLPPTRAWLLHRVWIFAAGVVTLVAAAPRVVAAAREDVPISRAAGVYAWESGPTSDGAPPDARFRWTRGRAALREPVRGSLLTVPLYVARPLPARLHVAVNGVETDSTTLLANGWHVLRYDLSALLGENWQSEDTITLDFRVTPTFVPARAGASDDTRELGVGLGVVTWSGRDGASPGRD